MEVPSKRAGKCVMALSGFQPSVELRLFDRTTSNEIQLLPVLFWKAFAQTTNSLQRIIGPNLGQAQRTWSFNTPVSILQLRRESLSGINWKDSIVTGSTRVPAA